MDFDGDDSFSHNDDEDDSGMTHEQKMEELGKMAMLFRIAGKVTFFIDKSEPDNPTPTFAFWKDSTFGFSVK